MFIAGRHSRVSAAVQNLFNLGKQLVRAQHYRSLKVIAFGDRRRAVALDWQLVFSGREDLICQYCLTPSLTSAFMG